MTKAGLTITYALLLILLGIIAYFVTDRASITALIPAFFGIVLLLLGFLMRRSTLPKIMLAIAAILALVGLVATVEGLGRVLTGTYGPDDPMVAAQVERAIMAVLSGVYLVFLLRGVILPRREHPEEPTAPRR